ncbi:hypothetical protein L914_16071 [Phytophthora nicotianae]|uniref:Uncharacterized protein n=2 Tax=Phytophthora nicotianae TaxID=4792 RepID=W2MM42_PHYNI|nr:hypothetical protein L914_16071 [Phytophthora nicotianae]
MRVCRVLGTLWAIVSLVSAFMLRTCTVARNSSSLVFTFEQELSESNQELKSREAPADDDNAEERIVVKSIDFSSLLKTKEPSTSTTGFSPYVKGNQTQKLPLPRDGSRYSPYNRENPTEPPTPLPTPARTIAPAATPPPNWVGPTIGKSSDTACYRKTYPTDSAGTCSLGYSKENEACAAQCPLSYPVECAAECIPQNDDCTLAVLNKVTSVLSVAVNIATSGVFSSILSAYNAIKRGVTCATNLYSVSVELAQFLRYRQTSTNGTEEELLSIAYSSDVFLIDMPVAICNCLGLPVPANAKYADMVLTVAENIAKQLITNRDTVLSSADEFMKFLQTTDGTNVTKELDNESITNLTTLIESGSTCGYKLKRLTDRVISSVNDLRVKTPDISKEDIRSFMGRSPLVLNDVPIVTNECLGELLLTKTKEAAYESRDVLRKSFGVIIDQLIDKSKTDLGASLTADEYMLQVSNMGLLVLSSMDPTGITYMTSQFVQPICGPTEFLGEIDDGSLADALGLKTKDDAFAGSDGTWKKAGDGVVQLTFVSTDTEDVTVVVHSGGDAVAEVKVGNGETVVWTSTVGALQDKTMYLDRWRPGFLGIPGSGGGSLLLWIPRSSAGGHLEMNVKVNVS